MNGKEFNKFCNYLCKDVKGQKTYYKETGVPAQQQKQWIFCLTINECQNKLKDKNAIPSNCPFREEASFKRYKILEVK